MWQTPNAFPSILSIQTIETIINNYYCYYYSEVNKEEKRKRRKGMTYLLIVERKIKEKGGNEFPVQHRVRHQINKIGKIHHKSK